MLLPRTQTPGCVPAAMTDRGALGMTTLEVGRQQGMELETPSCILSQTSLLCNHKKGCFFKKHPCPPIYEGNKITS